MKTKILFITLLLLIIGCSKEPINEDSLQTRGGLKYEINQTTPYSGPTFMTHENGEISFKGKYKNGIKDGLFEEFYDNGQLKKSVIYNGGTESGESVLFSSVSFDSAQIHSIDMMKHLSKQPKLSEVVGLSARFMYLQPAGRFDYTNGKTWGHRSSCNRCRWIRFGDGRRGRIRNWRLEEVLRTGKTGAIHAAHICGSTAIPDDLWHRSHVHHEGQGCRWPRG
mgnify:CR=1 FL=1